MIAGVKPRNTVDRERMKGALHVQWDIRRVRETGSTNEDAFILGRTGEPAGTVIVAGSQTRGRGRMSRSWFSPPGAGLYCSVLLRPSVSLQDAGLLSLCAALAMTDAVRDSGLQVSVKWPNDIVFGGRKLCGILSACDGSADGLRFAVVGSGLNLLPGSYPEELRNRAACLADFGVRAEPDDILCRYLDLLSGAVKILEKEGFSPLRRREPVGIPRQREKRRISRADRALGIRGDRDERGHGEQADGR